MTFRLNLYILFSSFKTKEVYSNCSQIADDVPEALRTTDEEQMKIIFTFCSQKYEECEINAMHQWYEQWKKEHRGDHSQDQSGDHTRGQNGDNSHNREEWKKRDEERIVNYLFIVQMQNV
jgi:hypothetical protein